MIESKHNQQSITDYINNDQRLLNLSQRISENDRERLFLQHWQEITDLNPSEDVAHFLKAAIQEKKGKRLAFLISRSDESQLGNRINDINESVAAGLLTQEQSDDLYTKIQDRQQSIIEEKIKSYGEGYTAILKGLIDKAYKNGLLRTDQIQVLKELLGGSDSTPDSQTVSSSSSDSQPQIGNRAVENISRTTTVAETSMSGEELDEYMVVLANETGNFLASDNHGKPDRSGMYYHFDFDPTMKKKEAWEFAYDRVAANHAATLSESERNEIQKNQDSLFKLHLQFSKEEWFVIVPLILKTLQEDKPKIRRMWEEKLKDGTSNVVSSEDLKKYDIKLFHLRLWKVQPTDTLYSYMPTMVCYTTETKLTSGEDMLKGLVQDLATLFTEQGITLPETGAPRFSAPVIKGDEAIPGFYYVQGDGDWKEYLKSQGKLDAVYNGQNNHATRLGKDVKFT